MYRCLCLDAADPCNSFTELDEPWRKVTNKVTSTSDNLYCDRLLMDGWYSFKEAEMPFDTCPSTYSCGTHIPIWINGTKPTVNNKASCCVYCDNDTLVLIDIRDTQ